MRLVIGEDQRGPVVSATVLVTSVALLGLTVFAGLSVRALGPIMALTVLFAVAHRALLRWQSLIALIVFVILFIPIKRYSLPASLPINLEPYRLLVFFVAFAWITSLLIDPRVRLRRTPIDRPLGLFALMVLASEVVNRQRVVSVEPEVLKKLLFFLSFFIVFYLIVSVVRRWEDVNFVTQVLVAGGAIVGLLAMLESYTGYDVFDHLQSVVPFLHLDRANVPHVPSRGGRLRVFASAQHPIALGAVLAMLVPFAIYLAVSRRQRRWWVAAMLLTFGSLVTGSRTGIVMFGVIALTYLFLRPVQLRRFWPALIPALLAIHFAAPGALGSIRASFFPKGGIVAQQANAPVGSGRLATLGPSLHREFNPNPLLGEGFGTRVTQPTPAVPVPNAPILDDQWLGILLETGLLGALSLVWLFVRLIRRLLPEARDADSRRSWYLAGVIASVASFAASMLFYDAFSFIQVTFVLFIVMGLGVSALLAPEPEPIPRKALQTRVASRRVDRPHGQLG